MDYVFHVAGIKGSPKAAYERPAQFMVPMLQFNTNMMEAAHENSVLWYMYTSSNGVYSPAPLMNEEDVWSSSPSENDFYAGWTKRIGELQAMAYEKQNNFSKGSIVRPGNIYGRHDSFAHGSSMVIPSLIRKAYENEKLEVWGDGSSIRDFIHASDVASGMIHVVKNKITEPVNLGSGTGLTIKKIAKHISSFFEKEIVWDLSKPSGDKIRILNTKKAKSIGFIPEVGIKEGLNDTCEWFVSNYKLIDSRYNAFKGKK
jgi:GDP-L-fucose synthase